MTDHKPKDAAEAMTAKQAYLEAARRLEAAARALRKFASQDGGRPPAGVEWFFHNGVDMLLCSPRHARESVLRALGHVDHRWSEDVDSTGWGVAVYVERVVEASRGPNPYGGDGDLVTYELAPAPTPEDVQEGE
jgi:hypothetical protein